MSKIEYQRAAHAGSESIQGCSVSSRRLRVPILRAHASGMFPEILKEYGDRVTLFTRLPMEMHPWADARGGGRQLSGRAEQTMLLGFCGLHSRQPARGEQRENTCGAADALDRLTFTAGPETQS